MILAERDTRKRQGEALSDIAKEARGEDEASGGPCQSMAAGLDFLSVFSYHTLFFW